MFDVLANDLSKMALSEHQGRLMKLKLEEERNFSLGTVASAAYAPNGGQVVTVGGRGIFLWDAAKGTLLQELIGDYRGATFAPDSRSLVTGGKGGTLLSWGLGSKPPIVIHKEHSGGFVPGTFSFRRDGERIISCSCSADAYVWDLKKGQRISALTEHSYDGVNAVAFSPDGTRVATGERVSPIKDGQGVIRLWDAENGHLLATYTTQRPVHSIDSLWFSANGERLYAQGKRAVCTFDTRTKQELAPLVELSGETPEGVSLSCATTTDDRTAIGRTDGLLYTMAESGVLKTYSTGAEIKSVAIEPNGGHVLIVEYGERARSWNLDTQSFEYELTGHGGALPQVEFLDHGTKLVSDMGDNYGGGAIKVWDVNDGRLCSSFPPFHESTTLFSPGAATGDLVFLKGSPDGFVLVDPHSGTTRCRVIIPNFLNQNRMRLRATISGDGKTIASVCGDDDQALILADAITGGIKRKLGPPGHLGSVQALAFNSNGSLLASTSSDRSTRVWNVADGSMVKVFRDHKAGGTTVAFDRSGELLAAADQSGTVFVWSLPSGVLVGKLRLKDGERMALDFRADGILAIGTDVGITFWHPKANEKLATVKSSSLIYSLRFSPDSRWLASGSLDGAIRLWKMRDSS